MPDPEVAVTQRPRPASAPAAVAPSEHRCTTPDCPGPVVVQWQRRLSEVEYQTFIAAEQARRERIRALADPQLPAPAFGPLPARDECTRAVHACARHAISIELAAHVHAADCIPAADLHPGCPCTPEPHPVPPALVPVDLVTIPSGWTIPVAPAQVPSEETV